jgi:hypothetical protein
MSAGRVLTAAAVVLSIGTPAAAQRAGVFVGLSAASVRIEPSAASWESVANVTAGGFVELGSGWLRLRPEVVLLRRGSDQVDYRAMIRMTHLQLPVLIAVTPNNGSMRITPIAYFGPSLGVKLDCTAQVATIEGEEITSSCEDAGWSLRPVEAAGIAGGGLHVPVGTATFILEARHVRPLNPAPPRGHERQVSSTATSVAGGVIFRIR